MKWPLFIVSTFDIEVEGGRPSTRGERITYGTSKISETAQDKIGTLVLRYRQRRFDEEGQKFRDGFKQLIARKDLLKKQDIVSQLNQCLQDPRPQDSFQIMWNVEAKDDSNWLDIWLFRTVARLKFEYDHNARGLKLVDDVGYIDSRLGRKFGPFQVYLRLRPRNSSKEGKQLHSLLEFWITFDAEKDCQDLDGNPIALANIPNLIILKSKRVILSTALVYVFQEEVHGPEPTKPRRVSKILVFGFVLLILLICLNFYDNFAVQHANVIRNLFWATFLTIISGISRTIIFHGEKVLGWGILLSGVAVISYHFGWTIENIPFSAICGVPGGLCVFYTIVPAAIGIVLNIFAIFCLLLAIMLSIAIFGSTHMTNPAHGFVAGIIFILVLVALAIGSFCLARHCIKRQDHIDAEDFKNRKNPGRLN